MAIFISEINFRLVKVDGTSRETIVAN